MNSEHYRYLRDNPEYREEFILDVMREEMSYTLPWSPLSQQESPPEAPKRVEMTPKEFRNRLLQLQGKLNHLTNALNEHVDKAVIASKKKEDSTYK